MKTYTNIDFIYSSLSRIILQIILSFFYFFPITFISDDILSAAQGLDYFKGYLNIRYSNTLIELTTLLK